MTRPGFDEKGFQWAWDATSLTALMQCPRKYQYSILDGWRLPPGQGGDHHLVFGKLLHGAWEIIKFNLVHGLSRDDALLDALEWLFKEAWVETTVWKCSSCEHTVGPKAEDHTGTCGYCGADFTSHSPVGETTGQYWTSRDKHKNFPYLIRTIVWGFEDLGRVMRTAVLDGRPMVEWGLERMLPRRTPGGSTYVMRAKLDEVVEELPGLNWIVEKKTTKTTLSPSYFKRFDVNVQTSHQAWLGAGAPIPIAGVVVEAHQVLVGSSRFDTHRVRFSREHEAEWEQVLNYWLDCAEKFVYDGFYPLNKAVCNLDGGCPFRGVCVKPPSLRQGFLEANFVKVLWDPSKGEQIKVEDVE